MRITSKKQIPDYCEWFLKNVRHPARAKDIISYMLENHHDGNRISVRPESFSARMKMHPDTFRSVENGRKGILWELVGD